MAQPVTAVPVVLENDQSTARFGQSIAASFEAKALRERELKNALLKQQMQNNAIFGDQVQNLQEWYGKSNLPTERRDMILNDAVSLLSKNINDPQFVRAAPLLANKAFQQFSGWNQYLSDADKAAQDLAGKYGVDPNKVKVFANNYMSDYNTVEGNPVKTYKDISKVGNISSVIEEEIINHPTLYVDQPKLASAAYTDYDKIFKGEAKGSKLTLDPTGSKTLTLGTDYNVTPLDIEVEKIEPETGLKYKKPVLDVMPSTGTITKVDGTPYQLLNEDKYEMFISRATPSIRQQVYVSAINKINEHNAEAFVKAGIDPRAALAISKNNASSFENVKGYVNPFDTPSLDIFQRFAAANFIKNSGRYNKNGEVLGFKIDAGVNKAKPSAVFNIGGIGTPGGIQDPYEELFKQVSSGKSLKNVNTMYQDFILKTANELKPKAGGKLKYTNANTEIKYNSVDGSLELYDLKGNFIIPVDQQSFRTGVLGEVSGKAKVEGFKAGENNPPEGKVITKEEFLKMNITERQEFKKAGGSYK